MDKDNKNLENVNNQEKEKEESSFMKRLKEAFGGFSEKDMESDEATINLEDSPSEKKEAMALEEISNAEAMDEANREDLPNSIENSTSEEKEWIDSEEPEAQMESSSETKSEDVPLTKEELKQKVKEDKRLKEEKEAKRAEHKVFMNIFMWIVILAIDVAAVFGIIGNIEELQTLPDTDLPYYLAIMDLFANFLEILFTISLILPGRKKKRHIRFQRRISYFLNLMIGFATSLLITNIKEMYPHYDEKAYYMSHIPLLVMLGIVLIFIIFAKIKIEAKTAKTKELIIYLYIFSGVIFVYQVFTLIMGNANLEEILHLIMAISSFGFIYFYQKIAPKKLMDQRHAWVYAYNGKNILVYSKAIVNVPSMKTPAVFSGIACLIHAAVSAITLMVLPDFQEQWKNIINARQFQDIFALGLALSMIFLLLSVFCCFKFFGSLKQNNAKNIMIGQLFVSLMTASEIFFCQFSSKGFEDFIEGSLPFAMYLTLAMLPFLFTKSAMDQHEIKAFESCTGPLEWGDLLCIVLILFAYLGSQNFAAIIAIVSILLNYVFLCNARRHGFLEYEEADDKETVEFKDVIQ